MIKVPVVKTLLDSLSQQVALLRPLQGVSLKELTDDLLRWNGVLHVLQVSVEHVTDIGAHLLAGSGAGVPDSHREIVVKLGRSGILPYEFAQRIEPMMGFRNIVVHHYLSVDPLKVADILSNHLGDFDEFAVYVTDYLRRKGYLSSEEQGT